MRLFRLAPVAALLLLATSCRQDDLGVNLITKSAVVMDGTQEVPSKPGAGNGTIDYTYNRTTRTLSYTVKWNSLSGVPIAMHIHGTAPKGVNAGIVQTFSGFTSSQTGTYTGTFFVDNVVVKEADFLNGVYYINLHNALNPGGEIRGQLTFTN